MHFCHPITLSRTPAPTVTYGWLALAYKPTPLPFRLENGGFYISFFQHFFRCFSFFFNVIFCSLFVPEYHQMLYTS